MRFQQIRATFGVGLMTVGFAAVVAATLRAGDPFSLLSGMQWIAVAVGAGAVGLGCWWILRPNTPWFASRECIWVADIMLTVFVLSFESAVAAMPLLFLFAVIGCYAGSVHTLTVYLAHQGWVLMSSCILIVRALASPQQSTATVSVFAAVLVSALLLAPTITQLSVFELREAAASANYDSLTGLLNRRGLYGRASAVARMARLSRTAISVIVFDIDAFKTINDRFGHAAGDLVLEAVARSLVDCFPEPAAVARTGGEEFAVLVPARANITEERSAEFTAVAAHSAGLALHGVADVAVTLSFGISEYEPASGDSEPATDDWLPSILARADELMYLSKRAGGNRGTTDL
ncbi:Hypothetical membrane protein [Rhodococcus sp. AW25M09]|nr:Hypothetical membrane protein [Rhodococcus sp. AW25M09]